MSLYPFPSHSRPMPLVHLSELPDARPIVGYKNVWITPDGTVWTCFLRGPQRCPEGYVRALRGARDTDGYLRVTLTREEGGQRAVAVAPLVLTTFRGPRPDGMECRHLDGDKTNATLQNLAWGTHSENELDKRRHGTALRGGDVASAKLSADDVVEIRRLAKVPGYTLRDIARLFGVTAMNIGLIVRRKTWAHIGEGGA